MLTSNRNTTEPEPSFNVQDIRDGVLWSEDDRFGNKPVLVTLYGTDHRSLIFGRLIVMNHADATQELE